MDRFYRALFEQLLRVHLNKAAKLDEFFSLLFKAVKADNHPQRVLAFIRRIIQMATLNEASFTAASLLIVSELIREKSDLRFQLYSFDTITKTKRTAKSGDSDSEEEHFRDVDKDEEIDHKEAIEPKVTKQNMVVYDPLKREPKYANAESSALFELIQLTYHTHPTVKLWATKLLEGEVINYNGDPLLDFGLANFLDRISYKNPKSVEKLAKFNSGRRMAATEQPINLYDFSGTGAENDMPKDKREEEQYLYKYFNQRGPKATKAVKSNQETGDDSDEDPEMELFANQVIEKEMKKMTKQADGLDEEDDDVLSDLENEDDDEDMEDEDEEDDDEGDFFDGENDLQEVKVGSEEEDDSEMEMGGADDEEIDDEGGDEYGGEQDEDDEEEDDIFDKKGKSSKSNKKKKEKKSIFADYDEFAHLLEGNLYEQGDSKKQKEYAGQKRSHNSSGGHHHKTQRRRK